MASARDPKPLRIAEAIRCDVSHAQQLQEMRTQTHHLAAALKLASRGWRDVKAHPQSEVVPRVKSCFLDARQSFVPRFPVQLVWVVSKLE